MDWRYHYPELLFALLGMTRPDEIFDFPAYFSYVPFPWLQVARVHVRRFVQLCKQAFSKEI